MSVRDHDTALGAPTEGSSDAPICSLSIRGSKSNEFCLLLPLPQIDEACVCGRASDRKVLVPLEKGGRLGTLALQLPPACGDEVTRPEPAQVVDHDRRDIRRFEAPSLEV